MADSRLTIPDEVWDAVLAETPAAPFEARADQQKAVEAATPLIVAAAFEQLADELGTKGTLGHASAGDNHTAALVAVTELATAAWIRRRAADLRRLAS